MAAEPIHAVVVASNVPSAQNGAGDELAIQYDVDVDMPDGVVIRITGDTQSLPRRWPSTVLCKPHPTGKSVLGFLVNNQIVLDYRAQPESEICGQTTP